MTNKATLVVNAFLKLSELEKQEVIVEIDSYRRKDYLEKGRMNEDFSERTKRITGPVSSAVCQFCGK